MPVPDHTAYLTRGSSRAPSGTRTTAHIADIYNRVELTRRHIQTPPWRSYRHVTNTRDARQQRPDDGRTPIPETQSPTDGATTFGSADLSRSRPNTAFDVLSQLTFSPLPFPEDADNNDFDDDEEGERPDEGSRCLPSQRSDVGVYFLHGSGSSDEGGAAGSPDHHPLASTARQTSDVRSSMSEPARYAASRGFCVRSRSALIREDDPGQVNNLSRQCCEVLGPKICHQCAITRRRSRDTRRYRSFLPQVDVDEDDLTTALLVAKNYPHLSPEDIQTKLSRGEILKPVFRQSVRRLLERRGENDQKTRTDEMAPTRLSLLTNANGATYNFFTSIRDLNDKIVSGQVVRKIILTGDPRKDLAKPQTVSRHSGRRAAGQSFSESVSPTFVSPRKVRYDKRADSAWYEPPLIPKLCQNNQSLYAGSQQAYSLDLPS